MIKRNEYFITRLACYTTNLSMSVVANLSPIIFIALRELYGISYSLIGLLVVVNFSTQLLVDLFFSFFSHRVNNELAVRITPLLTVAGLLLFAAAPLLFAGNEFVGLVLGTVVFSASGGLGEVLISPVIAAIPSENPDREVSKLHSVYAWGVVFVVPLASLFIHLAGKELWWLLSLILAVIPLVASILFLGAKLPALTKAKSEGGVAGYLKSPVLWLFLVAIFLGGAAECTMSQWSSSYIERALGIDKLLGDILGVALFAAMLGLGRTLYSKFGKSAEPVLLVGSLGAVGCYLLAALSPFPALGLVACALTGFCTSMLWPGSLICAAGRLGGGVFVYAIMAAGGDLGASFGPQLVGIITDLVIESPDAFLFLGGSAEEIGMRVGMLFAALFPALGAAIYFIMLRLSKKGRTEKK